MTDIQTLSNEKLKELAGYEAPLCLTMTMPCVRTGDQQKQNPIRYKNLLQEAKAKLEKLDKSDREIEDFLQPAGELQDNLDFWKHQNEGFMVCMADDRFEYFSLPFEVDVNVIADRHFYLRPVIPNMQHSYEPAILLLSLENPVLVFCQEQEAKSEFCRPEAPYESFEQYMGVFDQEEFLQFRSQGYDGGTRQTKPGYHGQGTAGDEATEKDHIREYCKQLENWVYDLLAACGKQEFFLVADPALEGIYKNVMRKGHPELRCLAQKNPESRNAEDWAKEARATLSRSEEEERKNILAEYERMKTQSEENVHETIPAIVRAAYNRQIDTLMLPEISQDYFWGRFDPETREVQKQKQDESVTGAGDELLNLAVIQTYLNGGKIVSLPEETMSEYAALCRW